MRMSKNRIPDLLTDFGPARRAGELALRGRRLLARAHPG